MKPIGRIASLSFLVSCLVVSGAGAAPASESGPPPRSSPAAERQVLFFDDFSDGTVGTADPQWMVAHGSWKVAAPAGYAGGNVLKSSKTRSATVLVRDEEIAGGGFVAGRISLRFKFGAAMSLPQASFFFDSASPDEYREVWLKQRSSGTWSMILYQGGNYDGDIERTVASVKLKGFIRTHWHHLEITIGENGHVDITLADETNPAKTWTLYGDFWGPDTGGSVGIWSGKTALFVDAYLLEGLPLP